MMKKSAKQNHQLTGASPQLSFFKNHRFIIILVIPFLLHTLFFVLGGIISFERMQVGGIDPVCYYSYLRSIVFDGDLDFENEYRALDETGVLLSYPHTPLGRRPNGFSIGPAMAAAPFFLAAHGLVSLTGIAPADGYSPPYHVSCFMALALYSLAGLILLFKWAREFFKPEAALAGVLFTWFSSSAVYYAYPITFMPHSISAFFVILFLYYAYKSRGQVRRGRWILVGMLAGAMSLMRWQNSLFVLFLFPDVISLHRERKRLLSRNLGLFFLSTLVIFLPQLIAWWRLYGRPFTVPQGGGFLLWARPMIVKILFSTFNGLFTWTPITLVGLFGLFLWMRKDGRRSVPILLFILFLLQLYLNSAVVDWHGSWGFGMRRFLNCLPIFALGLAALVETLRKRSRFLLPCLLLSIFVIWNYLFLVQYYLHLVAWNRPLTFHEMVGDKLHIRTSIERRRLVNTAYLSASRGYMDDVETALRLAREIDPQHEDIYLAGGRIAASQGEVKTALEFFRRALELAPEDRDIMRELKALRRLRDKIDSVSPP